MNTATLLATTLPPFATLLLICLSFALLLLVTPTPSLVIMALVGLGLEIMRQYLRWSAGTYTKEAYRIWTLRLSHLFLGGECALAVLFLAALVKGHLFLSYGLYLR